jgi:glycosyltransferase involved in cell wall biosynthesis
MSAGASIVTKSLLDMLEQITLPTKIHVFVPKVKIFEEFKERNNLRIIRVPVLWGPFKYLFRFVYEFVILPAIISIKKTDVVLVMANYSPLKLKSRKIVLMQHSYLVDESIYPQVRFKTRIVETFRQLIFRWTVRSSDDIIVQSRYMKSLLEKKYDIQNCNVHILPNPLSKHITSINCSKKQPEQPDEFVALYVSRFNPHKNYEFVLNLAENYEDAMRNENIKIYTTIDPDVAPLAEAFIKRIQTLKLDDIIVNIGEIPHEQISPFYQKASCLFFPSKTESFGNALIEAMYFGLPILVPDLGYARAVCENAGYYYTPDDVDDAFTRLCQICKNYSLRNKYAQRSLKQARKFPDVKQWANHMLRIIMQGR